jgi:hypothetical protein
MGIDAVLVLKNVGQDGEIYVRAVLSTSEGEFERTQKLVLKAKSNAKGQLSVPRAQREREKHPAQARVRALRQSAALHAQPELGQLLA